MQLCDDGHGEVAYEGRNCPACEERLRAEKAEELLAEAKEELREMRND
jgi:transcription initiation factor IIE alpha subunit